MQKPGVRFAMEPKFVQVGDDKVIASSRWFDEGNGSEERHVVFTFRDGMIADMQACGTWREAKRFARRHSL